MTDIEIMKALCVPSYSNSSGFTEDEKRTVMRELLKDSGYTEYEGTLTSVWTKSDNITTLVSTHIDMVHAITRPFAELNDGIYSGTWDNLITNSAIVSLMMEGAFADNVALAFDGEEESCSFAGLREALYHLENIQMPLKHVITTDVTHEAYESGVAVSIENMNSNEEEHEDMFSKITQVFGEDYHIPTFGAPDEAYLLKRLDTHIPGFSYCIPSSGPMHSNMGMTVEEDVYIRYRDGLAKLANIL
jgi:hypothetical protein